MDAIIRIENAITEQKVLIKVDLDKIEVIIKEHKTVIEKKNKMIDDSNSLIDSIQNKTNKFESSDDLEELKRQIEQMKSLIAKLKQTNNVDEVSTLEKDLADLQSKCKILLERIEKNNTVPISSTVGPNPPIDQNKEKTLNECNDLLTETKSKMVKIEQILLQIKVEI